MSHERFVDLKSRLAEIHDLGKVISLLNWDQAVTMPPGGAPHGPSSWRPSGRIAHELFVSPEIGRLLDDLQSYEDSLPYESDEASLIRVTRLDYEKARQVPTDLRTEMTRVASLVEDRVGWCPGELRLQGVPAVPAADARSEETVRGLLRAEWRSVRRAARRLRAWHADLRGAEHLHVT